jgi:DNA-binding transcriptional ArsR family regulator
MPKTELTTELLEIVASRFKALSEPARLEILASLSDGELCVTDLVDRTGLGQANLSKHLQVLHASGFVGRRKDGLFTYYELADRDVMRLMDLMTGRLETEHAVQRRILARR